MCPVTAVIATRTNHTGPALPAPTHLLISSADMGTVQKRFLNHPRFLIYPNQRWVLIDIAKSLSWVSISLSSAETCCRSQVWAPVQPEVCRANGNWAAGQAGNEQSIGGKGKRCRNISGSREAISCQPGLPQPSKLSVTMALVQSLARKHSLEEAGSCLLPFNRCWNR